VGNIDMHSTTDIVDMKLQYLDRLKHLRQFTWDKELIADLTSRITRVLNSIDKDLGLDKKETVDAGNTTVKLTVDTSEFEKRFEQVKRALDEIGPTAERAATNFSKAIEDIKSTASRLK